MTTGEITFTTRGVETKSGEIPPLPAGEYELKFLSSEIKCADGDGKIPYINLKLEVLDTAKDGFKKNRVIFPRLFLDLTPNTATGVSAVERKDGLVAFVRAQDTELEQVPGVTRTIEVDGKEVTQSFLVAREVNEQLKGLHGNTFRARLKIGKKTEKYAAQNEVAEFLPK